MRKVKLESSHLLSGRLFLRVRHDNIQTLGKLIFSESSLLNYSILQGGFHLSHLGAKEYAGWYMWGPGDSQLGHHSKWKSEDSQYIAEILDHGCVKKLTTILNFKNEARCVCQRVIDTAVQTEGDRIPGLHFSVPGKAVLLRPSQMTMTHLFVLLHNSTSQYAWKLHELKVEEKDTNA